MQARDLMTSPAITCHVNDSLSVAAHKMWDADIGALAVVNDEGKLTGMITDRDICMAAFTQGRTLEDLLVNSAMSKRAFSAPGGATLDAVEQLMAKHQIRRIPIVDDAGMPIGVISMNDLALASQQPRAKATQEPATIAYTLAAICKHREAELS